MTPAPSSLQSEWALELILRACGHALDPEALIDVLRHPVPGEEPIAHFERAAQSQRLVVTRRTVLLSDLGAQALPFVTFDGEVPIVVLERRGGSLKIQRGPDAEEWVDPRALGKESLVVLHCAPATPAEAFASHDHHLSPWQRLWAWARLERDDLFVV